MPGRRSGWSLTGVALLLTTACLADPPATPASASPSASATASVPAVPSAVVPLPAVTSPPPATVDTSARTTLHGKVYTALGDPVDGASVTAKVMGTGRFPNGSNTMTVTTQFGAYAFNGTPTGETVVITVTKSGLKTREQTIVPLANLSGNPRANKVDFGGDDPSTAL